MNEIATDMRLLDEWMREQNLDARVPDHVKSSPFDAAEEIERLEEIKKDLLEALEIIASEDCFDAETSARHRRIARAAIAVAEGRADP